jgi:hypothetical protein
VGNSAVDSSSNELTIDTTAPTISISTISGDDIINAVEDNVDVPISGSTTALMMSSPDMVLMLMVGAVVSMVNSLLLLSTALLPAASGITV